MLICDANVPIGGRHMENASVLRRQQRENPPPIALARSALARSAPAFADGGLISTGLLSALRDGDGCVSRGEDRGTLDCQFWQMRLRNFAAESEEGKTEGE